MIHRARSKDQDHVVASGWTWDSEFPVVICVSQQSILNVSCILEVVIQRGAGVRPNNLDRAAGFRTAWATCVVTYATWKSDLEH